MLHVPEGIDTSQEAGVSLCIHSTIIDHGSYLLELDQPAQARSNPPNLFRAQLAADRQTVDVIVGGGRSELTLSRCL